MSTAKPQRSQKGKKPNPNQNLFKKDGTPKAPNRAAKRKAAVKVLSKEPLLADAKQRSKKLSQFRDLHYSGILPGEYNVSANIYDIIAHAQLNVQQLCIQRPSAFSAEPSPGPIVNPSEYAAYLVACAYQAYMKMEQFTGAAITNQNFFNDDNYIPIGFAEYLRRTIRVIGTPTIRRVLNSGDCTLSNTAITPGATGTNVSVNCFSDTGMANLSVYPLVKSTTTFDFVLAAPAFVIPVGGYSGIFLGASPFISSAAFLRISTLLRSLQDYKVVRFGDVPLVTTDYSGFVTVVAPNNQQGTWANGNMIMSPNRNFDPDICPALQPNFGLTGVNTPVPYPLGHNAAVPVPTFTNFGFSNLGPTISGSMTIVAQNIQIFSKICSVQDKLCEGAQFKGKKGYKYYGLPIPRFDRFVTVPIDTFGVSSAMLKAIGFYLNSNFDNTGYLDPGLMNTFAIAAQAAVINRIYEVGQFEYLNNTGVTVAWPLQVSIPPDRFGESKFHPAWATILNEIGPAYANGALYIPVVNTNGFNTFTGLAGSIRYTNSYPSFSMYPGNYACGGGIIASTPIFPYMKLNPQLQTDVLTAYGANGVYVTTGAGSWTGTGGQTFTGNAQTFSYNAAQATAMAAATTAFGKECNIIWPFLFANDIILLVESFFKSKAWGFKGHLFNVVSKIGCSSMLTQIAAVSGVAGNGAYTNTIALSGGLLTAGTYSFITEQFIYNDVYSYAPLSSARVTRSLIVMPSVIYRVSVANFTLGSAYHFILASSNPAYIQDTYIAMMCNGNSDYVKKIDEFRTKRTLKENSDIMISNTKPDNGDDKALGENLDQVIIREEKMVDGTIDISAEDMLRIAEKLIAKDGSWVHDKGSVDASIIANMNQTNTDVKFGNDKVNWKTVGKGIGECAGVILTCLI